MKDVKGGRKDFPPGALIDIVQKGIQYKELQAQDTSSIQSGESEYKVFSARQLLRAKDPATLATSAISAQALPQAGSVPLQGHTGDVLAVCWHPRDADLATSSADSTARIWHWQQPSARSGSATSSLVPSDVLQHNLPFNSDAPSAVHNLAWAPNGLWLATSAFDGIIRIWGTGGVRSAMVGGKSNAPHLWALWAWHWSPAFSNSCCRWCSCRAHTETTLRCVALSSMMVVRVTAAHFAS
jgi:WD40 repeat protein